MKYLSGEKVEVNDLVLIEGGQTEAHVVRIVEAQEDIDEVRVKEPGVFLTAGQFGVVFCPIKEAKDPVKFISRGKTFKPFENLFELK